MCILVNIDMEQPIVLSLKKIKVRKISLLTFKGIDQKIQLRILEDSLKKRQNIGEDLKRIIKRFRID